MLPDLQLALDFFAIIHLLLCLLVVLIGVVVLLGQRNIALVIDNASVVLLLLVVLVICLFSHIGRLPLLLPRSIVLKVKRVGSRVSVQLLHSVPMGCLAAG